MHNFMFALNSEVQYRAQQRLLRCVVHFTAALKLNVSVIHGMSTAVPHPIPHDELPVRLHVRLDDPAPAQAAHGSGRRAG